MMDAKTSTMAKQIAEGLAVARAKRAELFKAYTAAGEELKVLESGLMALLSMELQRDESIPALKWRTADGKNATLTLDKVADAVPEDWDALYKHTILTGEFDLLHKRITTTAVKERWQEGKEVPGVAHIEKLVINLKTSKGK